MRVKIDNEDILMESVKGSAKVDGGCRFTDPAFLIGYREDASHGEFVGGVIGGLVVCSNI